MKNCGRRFHNEVGKYRFLNELIKVVSPKVSSLQIGLKWKACWLCVLPFSLFLTPPPPPKKNLSRFQYMGESAPEKVKMKIVEMLYSWTVAFPNETKIGEAYQTLRRQGVLRWATRWTQCLQWKDPSLSSLPSPGLVTQDPELPLDRTLIPSPPSRPKHPVFDNEDMGKVREPHLSCNVALLYEFVAIHTGCFKCELGKTSKGNNAPRWIIVLVTLCTSSPKSRAEWFVHGLFSWNEGWKCVCVCSAARWASPQQKSRGPPGSQPIDQKHGERGKSLPLLAAHKSNRINVVWIYLIWCHMSCMWRGKRGHCVWTVFVRMRFECRR